MLTLIVFKLVFFKILRFMSCVSCFVVDAIKTVAAVQLLVVHKKIIFWEKIHLIKYVSLFKAILSILLYYGVVYQNTIVLISFCIHF